MTSIEWTHPPGYKGEVWNPTAGCSLVSEGCRNCYAMKIAHRAMSPQHRGLTVLGKHGPRWNGKVRTLEHMVDKPLHWKKPRCIFVNSMSDLFHKKVPFAFVDRIVDVMLQTPQHRYIVLTKRPGLAATFWARWLAQGNDLPENLVMGTSVEDQATADERIPELLRCPDGLTLSISYEPALGPVDFERWLSWCDSNGPILRWIICGGESGPGSRTCNLEWLEMAAAQAQERGTAAFIKQLGSKPISGDEAVILDDSKGGDWSEWPLEMRIREYPEILRT